MNGFVKPGGLLGRLLGTHIFKNTSISNKITALSVISLLGTIGVAVITYFTLVEIGNQELDSVRASLETLLLPSVLSAFWYSRAFQNLL